MDPRLLRYYNRELQHLREMGAEFAQEFPKIAGRLGLEGFECADPYVERLLEGFAFLTARIQIKMDAEFPIFTQNLLEMVYPHFMAPVPSIAVVQLKPDLREAGLAEGVQVPRGSALHSVTAAEERTACEYRTAHDLDLWPIELKEVRYHDGPGSLAANGVRVDRNARAGLSLSFTVTAGVGVAALKLDQLPLYLAGSDVLPQVLYEHIMANASGVVVRGEGSSGPLDISLPAQSIQRVGFSEKEALIPYSGRSFSGYRLMQEYFSCPERFLFVNITRLQPALKRLSGSRFEIVILLDRVNSTLQRSLDVDNFRLFCTPAINLFPQRLDRIHLDRGRSEYHVVPDRTRPMDFEVYGLSRVDGYGDSAEPQLRFQPFYSAEERTWHSPMEAYYTLRREPRVLSMRSRQSGQRSSYIGSEVFLSLVDGRSAPYATSLRQLGIEAWCTNRDLPLGIPVGRGATDFTLDSGAPVEMIRCVAGPKKPRSSSAQGETSWHLLSHLSLNYLSLVESANSDSARAIREMLTLYCDPNNTSHIRQIHGIKSISAQQIVRRLPITGPITYGRGLEITVSSDETAFEGAGAYLIGSVLEEFFARYVSLNSFTETVLASVERGVVARWPARTGRRDVS